MYSYKNIFKTETEGGDDMLPTKRDSGLFDKFFDNDFFTPTFNTMFASEVGTDDDGNTILEIEVPGFNKDNLNVEVADSILTIQGQTNKKKLFKRYSLGNVDEVKASIKDGILTLTLIEEKKESVKVTIE